MCSVCFIFLQLPIIYVFSGRVNLYVRVNLLFKYEIFLLKAHVYTARIGTKKENKNI